jgi:large subunit ribosomal protein L2
MGLKSFKPHTPGTRQMTVQDFSEITRTTPEKSLTVGKRSTGGRNNQGRTTMRFRGGGVKRCLRQIDFKRDKDGIPATVAHIEYDPNRSARIALLHYKDGEKRYILLPLKVAVGDTLMSGPTAEVKPGNTLRLADIPDGVQIHAISMLPGKSASLVRTAGAVAEVRAKEGEYVTVKMPSGEIRRLNQNCRATIGQVGNLEHMNISLGKAGKKRYLGKKPHNRGVVMNPIDHPMGGGEGRTSGGGHPRSPWGQLAKGFKTRKKKNPTSKFIVERRKK